LGLPAARAVRQPHTAPNGARPATEISAPAGG